MNKLTSISCLKELAIGTTRKLAYNTQLFAQEEFLRRLSLRKNKNVFILTGLYSIYGRNQFPQKVSIPLEFELIDQEDLLMFIQEQLKEIIDGGESDVISLKIDYVKEKEDINHGKIIQAQIIGQIQKVKAPFIIKCYAKTKDIIKYKQVTYPVLIQEFKEPAVNTTLLEVIVAESLVQILEKKELLDSLNEIYKISYIATNFSVNGRKIKNQLRIYKEKEALWFPKEDFISVFQVIIDRQHQVKWKQFGNVLGEKETDFCQTIQLIKIFLEIIWENVFDDIEFFGDWMPELKRYIG